MPNKRGDLESTAAGQAFFQFIEQCKSMELNLKCHRIARRMSGSNPQRIKANHGKGHVWKKKALRYIIGRAPLPNYPEKNARVSNWYQYTLNKCCFSDKKVVFFTLDFCGGKLVSRSIPPFVFRASFRHVRSWGQDIFT